MRIPLNLRNRDDLFLTVRKRSKKGYSVAIHRVTSFSGIESMPSYYTEEELPSYPIGIRLVGQDLYDLIRRCITLADKLGPEVV